MSKNIAILYRVSSQAIASSSKLLIATVLKGMRSHYNAQRSLCLGFGLCVTRSHSFKHCTWKFGIRSKLFAYLSDRASIW
ncbi:hypothetical protein [Nostoc sphaeroides]|uniref:Uncharacterized protein n=1 Tax=Nostoc sphaeroides CCNUC1 TaxID=2653204 RepID=A0A5P8WCD8_9NOSO|nr:hypothetical protein [Nostoc sphaeroides]QFS50294.1 hypothetical protein GXM_07788 [Nostoc sphaeroides CCNUC1]